MGRAKEDRQTLTAARFAGLLARLDPDPARAGVEYEHLRRSLIKFFDWRGSSPADECADECLDRLARRLAEDVAVLDVRQFVHGIARFVLLERRRHPLMSSIDQESFSQQAEIAASRSAAEPSEKAVLADCFDQCLSQMPADQRALLLGYYEGETDRKIANRRRLSHAMGLSDNALRSRVQRLRNRLETCIETCRLGRSPEDAS